MIDVKIPYGPPGQSTQQELIRDYWKILSSMISEAFMSDPNRLALIDLEGLHDLLLRTWDQMEPLVHSHLENSSEEVLGQGDVIVSFGNFSYLLITSKAQPMSASALAQKIALKAEQNLFGTQKAQNIITVNQVTDLAEDGLIYQSDNKDDDFATDEMLSMPVDTESEKQLFVLGDVNYNLVPIWDVRRNNVLSYRLKTTWAVGENSIKDDSELEQLSDSSMKLVIDMSALQEAAKSINEVYEHNRFGSFILPVHYDILASSNLRTKYLDAVTNIWPIAPDRLYFEIESVPGDVDPNKLAESIASFHAFYNGILVTVPWGFDSFETLKKIGVYSIGVNVEHDDRSETEIMAEMEAFITKISRYPIRTHALGLKTMSLTVAAVCAGFDFVGGQPVTSSLEGWAPDDYLISPVDLYKKIISAKS